RTPVCPFENCIQSWTERLAPFGQSVLTFGGAWGYAGAMHNAVGLHAFPLLPQHCLCNAGDFTLKVGKTHNFATEEMEENDELPSAFEQAQGCFNIGSGRGRRITLRHLVS